MSILVGTSCNKIIIINYHPFWILAHKQRTHRVTWEGTLILFSPVCHMSVGPWAKRTCHMLIPIGATTPTCHLWRTCIHVTLPLNWSEWSVNAPRWHFQGSHAFPYAQRVAFPWSSSLADPLGRKSTFEIPRKSITSCCQVVGCGSGCRAHKSLGMSLRWPPRAHTCASYLSRKWLRLLSVPITKSEPSSTHVSPQAPPHPAFLPSVTLPSDATYLHCQSVFFQKQEQPTQQKTPKL